MHDRTALLEPLPDTTTLDGDRLDRFGTFLTVEAAADAAPASRPARHRTRRLVGGAVAATVLAGGLLAVNAIAGGPGPAAVEAAVAIEQEGGWTTITITDPGASPAEIEAALEVAGVDASIVADGNDPKHGAIPAAGFEREMSGVYLRPESPEGAFQRRAFYAVAAYEDTQPGDLTGIGVDFVLTDDLTSAGEDGITVVGPGEPAGSGLAVDGSDFDEILAAVGVRAGDDLPANTMSIRDGAEAEILLYTVR